MARHGCGGELSERHALFVKHYLIDLNATQAAIRAGYTAKHADVTGPQLMGNPRISAAINKAKYELEAKLEISAERTLQEIARVAYANYDDYVTHDNGDVTFDLSKCDRTQMAAVQEYTVDHTGGTGDGKREMILRTRGRLHDKTRALEMLAKYHPLYTDKLEITASDEVLEALAAGRKHAAKCQTR